MHLLNAKSLAAKRGFFYAFPSNIGIRNRIFEAQNKREMNPLLSPYNTPFDTPPFDKIKPADFTEAFEAALTEAKKNVEQVAQSPASFENTIVGLERASTRLDLISEMFFNLHSAETNDEIQEIAKQISPKLSAFANDVALNPELFAKIKEVNDTIDVSTLSEESARLLEKTYKSFTRNGALLNDADQAVLRKIDEELSTLKLEFSEHVLKETNAYKLHITEADKLQGLPEGALEAAAHAAEESGLEGWVFTLDFPSYMAFMTYASNRALRQELWMAFATRAAKGNENDNHQIVVRIATLRYERAKLLGFESHAAFVLAERMAEKPETVMNFLSDLREKALPAGQADLQMLADFAQKTDGIDKLERWDLNYYMEKLKMEKYAIDDEALKPYFPLDNVVDGMFTVAKKLYGITFVERHDIPKYHEEVKTYEVRDRDNQLVSVFYTDFFPRKGKRNGAWMTSYRGMWKTESEEIRPLVSIVCNFTRPTKTTPSLLTFNEVTTAFHEFGHALHGMLAKGNYASLTGTNVYWDFVELPSQIMENWCYQKEALDLFAKHYKTGESIPAELVEKIGKSATFMEGYATMRQLGFGYLDMAWHGGNPSNVTNVDAFEKEAMAPAEILPTVAGTSTSCAFSHIFSGGYSSGYYSYKWAEVLDADAFESFLDHGLFNTEVAEKFKTLLQSGGTVHPAKLYENFKGRPADSSALLRRAGFKI